MGESLSGASTGAFHFDLLQSDATTRARRGRFHTPHGTVETPAFMPVGTQGSVKGIEVQQLVATGSQMILANTYHLALRPGAAVVQALGGLHQFMGWQGPILTDSGGFQIFSLAEQVRVDEERALFRSHVDGQELSLSPEQAVAIQEQLGSDVAMVLDHVVALPSPPELVQLACERSIRWAERCLLAHRRRDQALFAIVQGGLDLALRRSCAESLGRFDFQGYAVGGLSVGETTEQMQQVLQHTVPRLPEDRPRYLMGVGRPEDILLAIRQGIDLFDCVMPTRNGRNALAFTDHGPVRIRNAAYTTECRPLDIDCPCVACQRSLGYLRHLFQAGEMLGPILLSIHNVSYYQRLMQRARIAIEQGQFANFLAERLAGWASHGVS